MHELIMASAGSGKTYRLSNRIISLLLAGVEPERVIALTFTRKAAGEFTSALFEKIAIAAGSPDKAAELSADLGHLGVYDQGHFLSILASVVEALPRMTLGTLDSFLTRIVQAFQLELGLSTGTGLKMLEETELAELREDILRNLLFGSLPQEQRHKFLQAFKEANYGKETVSVMDNLIEFTKKWHHVYLSLSELSYWGNIAPLLGNRNPKEWEDNREALLDQWEGLSSELDWTPKEQDTFAKVGEQLEKFEAGATSPKLSALHKRLLESLPELLTGELTAIKSGREEQPITPEQAQQIGAILLASCDGELRAHSIRSHAIGQVIAHYEVNYNRTIRQLGKLQFDDIKSLLSKWQQTEDDRLLRESIDYRLDAKFDHWLLDEFQDTSHDQWNSLSPLLDEIGQDRSGQRTLFVVGDVKQAIYGWRGGDSKLFYHVADKYGIERGNMSVSWRSQESVLHLVNTICGNKAVMQSVFGNAAHEWDWQGHQKAEKLEEKPAYSEVSIFDEKTDKHGHLLSILEDLQPTRRGLSCALLVNKNSDVKLYAELLRSAGHSVAEEGKFHPAMDNPVGLLILDLLKWLANPADAYALRHIQMSPLAGHLPALTDDVSSLWGSWTQLLTHAGSAALIETVMAPLRDEFDAFSESRLALLLDQLTEAPSDLAQLIPHLEGLAITAPEGSGFIQIMTVHKSKGLGFDLVFLPEIASRSLTNQSLDKVVLAADGEGALITNPSKWAQPAYPSIQEANQQYYLEQCYGTFCVLYVALTRAKQGLYCLMDQKTQSCSPAKWMQEALSALPEQPDPGDDSAPRLLYQHGEPRWYEQIKLSTSPPLTSQPAIQLTPLRGRQTATGEHSPRAFAPTSQAMERGGAMHNMMESIEWLPAPSEALPEELISRFQEQQWGGDLLVALAEPDLRRILTYPNVRDGETVTLYREQALEWIDERGLWNTVRLDRFWVIRDPLGLVAEIHLLDYKTDDIAVPEQLVPRHRQQLAQYRTGITQIYGASPIIHTHLVNLTHGYITSG